MQRLMRIAIVVGAFLPVSLVAQDIDPVGMYEWEADAGGQYVYGTFEITESEEGWTGKSVGDDGESPISQIEVAGSVVTFMVHTVAFGDVYVELRFENERFAGFASVGGEQVSMTGTKTAG